MRLIEVKNVHKKFCRDLKLSLKYGVSDIYGELRGRSGRNFSRLRRKEFWAVHDVSFSVEKGSCTGLIGPNGSGKSTLLRMINGLLKPDSGSITLKGRVMALINLGAGFNPILTGRENIYINAAVLGNTKRDTNKIIDEIIDFSGIEDAIDSPVMSYSSGMRVRLGFSVAAHMKPDVLLLDEVLAVGDAEFRERCYRRIAAMKKTSAVIFVSHNMEQIDRICDQTLVLQNGKSICSGETSEAILKYDEIMRSHGEGEAGFISIQPPITSFNVQTKETKIKSNSCLDLEVTLDSESNLEDFTFRIIIYNSSGGFAGDCNLSPQSDGISIIPGLNRWRLRIQPLALRNGIYKFGFNVIDRSGDLVVWSYKEYEIQVYGGYSAALSDYQLTAIGVTDHG